MSPPLYKDFGKAANDLLTKDFPTTYKVEYDTTSADGVNIVASLAQRPDGTLFASLAPKYKFPRYGVEVKSSIDSKQLVKTDVTVEKVFPGLKALFSSTAGSARGVKGGFEYLNARGNLTGNLDYPLGGPAPSLHFSAVFKGTDAISLGSDCEYSLGETPELSRVTAAVAYDQVDLGLVLGTTITQDQNSVNLTYIQKVAAVNGSVAGKLNYDLKKSNVDFSGVVSYTLSHNSAFKAKLDNNGLAGISYVNKLNNNTKLTVGSEFSVAKPERVPTFAVNLNFNN